MNISILFLQFYYGHFIYLSVIFLNKRTEKRKKEYKNLIINFFFNIFSRNIIFRIL